jgi:predicted dienelactone hydrolase
MTQSESFSQRWENFRPSKALWFWSVAGAAVATMVVGFSFGGWTTGGSAATMAAQAARDARAELVASVCVDNFVASENSAAQLVALKETSSWKRDDLIEDGGWAKLAGMEKSVPGAADLCAKQLVAMDDLPVQNVEVEPASTGG